MTADHFGRRFGPADPDMFAPLTGKESDELRSRLMTGWFEQLDVYPSRSETWLETREILQDIHTQRMAAIDAAIGGQSAAPEPGCEPEAG